MKILSTAQQIIDSEAFKKRREKITKVIALDYTNNNKRRRYREEEKSEEERYKNTLRKIITLLSRSDKQRRELYINNAYKQKIVIVATLKVIENTYYRDLNAFI